MPTPIQIFHTFCRNQMLGDPFTPTPNLDGIFSSQRSVVDGWIRNVQGKVLPGKSLPPIHFEYLTRGTFNGLATVIQGEGFIGLTRGSVLLPYDLFYRIMSHPSLLPEIGDPSQEFVDQQHEGGLGDDFDDVMQLRGKFTRVAKDPVRNGFADLCVKVAFDFLITHELAHISHGHLGNHPGQSSPFITEFALAHGLSRADALHSQALEMDADASGTTMSLSKLFYFAERKDVLPAEWLGLLDSPEKVVFLWAFAVSGLFHTWGLQIDTCDMLELHPPTAIRYWLARMTAASWLLTKRTQFGDAAIEAIHLAGMSFLQAMQALGSTTIQEEWDALKTVCVDPMAQTHQEEIMEEWDKIHDQLKQFAVVPIAPKRPPGTKIYANP